MRYSYAFAFTHAFVFFCLFVAFPVYSAAEKIDPPWESSPQGGVNFTVPGVDNAPDLYGDINDPDLAIFLGGNEFMVLPEIVEAFKAAHPKYKRIFYETLPPGIVEEHLRTGSLVMGNLRITVKPDIFMGGKERVEALEKEGWFDETAPYAQNRLAIMVERGNPGNIKSLPDLGRDEVRVSMPDPKIEDIGKKIIESYRKAGGESLERKIMEEKVKNGTTIITQIHHRQTPMWIMRRLADAGPVWYTEAYFQQMIGNPIDMVEIPENENSTSTSIAARLKGAPHAQAALDFLAFIRSEKGQAIYKKYGFMPPQS